MRTSTSPFPFYMAQSDVNGCLKANLMIFQEIKQLLLILHLPNSHNNAMFCRSNILFSFITQYSMESAEHVSKVAPSRAAAMEMRRMSLIRPLPSTDVNKVSEVSFESSSIRSKTLDILNGLPYNIFITIITFYVLFADDFRQVFFPPKADLPFTIVVIICMVIYTVEIILSCYARTGYFLSFFFWLDFISTGTMVFDLMWINVGGSAGVATNIVQIARAGKASRIGARSARMIRIVKLIKMVQEYKTAKQEMTSEQGKQVEGLLDGLQKKTEEQKPERRRGLVAVDPSATAIVGSTADYSDNLHQQMMRRAQQRKSSKEIKLQTFSQIVDLKETRVGIKLKEEMETNTTMMIMLVLVSVPLLSSSTWFQETSVYEDSINQLGFFLNSGTDNLTKEIELNIFISQSLDLRDSLVYLDFPINTTCCNFPRDFPTLGQNIPELDSIRASSTNSFTLGDITVVYDTTGYDIFTSQLNIGRTLFVCILLIFSSLFFSQDVEDYLLSPLESMLVTVKRIAADPLKAIIALENQNLIKQTIKTDEVKEQELTNQPAILENLIVKIGSLLVVGFGEAGSQIMAKNIEAHGAINPVLSGTKMIAIFGFCDIRNFTDATEVLQTGVMNFVNDVAEIVHGIIHKCGGSANKNIGDAFLLVWKFKQKEVFLSDNNGKTEVTLRRIKKVSQIADLAVYSFMKIVADLGKAPKLVKYTQNKNLKERIKNFTGVKMGFGLHVGWAIEGAIGSSFKIDASYLSPNVNMASRLEAATKQFGVFILVSGNVVQLMTPTNQKLMRHIDRVTVKGSIEPIDFFTLDICPSVFFTENEDSIEYEKPKHEQKNIDKTAINKMEKKKQKMFAHKTREAILNNIESGKNVTERIFVTDKDFEKMREPYSPEFFIEWARAYDYYIKGQWGQARSVLQGTLRINPDMIDGPSNTLMEVLESYNFEAPANWAGFRQLTEK